ncbi:MAG TPA: NAD(P)-dependent alcohol dehydrogenase [Burkholderiales bacterium]|nr:NAD(P)-dependent alcohol dehydrogenase [Burkholderiales bacterium]
MKAHELDLSKKGFDAIQLKERPQTQPGPGQVLIRMQAFSLNFRDLLIINHLYPVATGSQGLIPVSDGAGEVVEVGEGVTRFRKGDRVMGSFFQGWADGPLTYPAMGTSLGGAIDGVLAEYVALSEEGVITIPAGLSYEEAATLPCAGVTAWHALVESGNIREGQSVLLLGTGGVSIFGLQIAKAFGAKAFITSSSDEKLTRVPGADGMINYKRRPDWEKDVLELTGGAGADHIIETAGAGTLQKSLQSVAIHGQINIIGVLTGLKGNVDLSPLLVKTARMQGIFVGSRAMLERLAAFVEEHRIKPVIDRVFSFGQTIDAYKYLAAAQHFGKVVIKV